MTHHLKYTLMFQAWGSVIERERHCEGASLRYAKINV